MCVLDAVTEIFGKIYHMTDPVLMQKLVAAASVQTYEKGEIIQKSGDKQLKAAFLISGVVRAYFSTGKGEELTDCFICDLGYPAMTPDVNRPAFISSEAVNCVELLTIPIETIFQLMEEHTQVLWAYNQMLHWALLFHWQIKTSRVCFNGTERYAWFRENFPEADRVAYGKHIASFLGITPETLSRIRKAQAEPDVYPIMVERKTDTSSDDLLKKMQNGFEAGKIDAVYIE